MTQFSDLGDMDEDSRINVIGRTARKTGGVIGFIVDDWPGKADRYKAKLARRFPDVEIINTTAGPVAGTTLVRVQVKPS